MDRDTAVGSLEGVGEVDEAAGHAEAVDAEGCRVGGVVVEGVVLNDDAGRARVDVDFPDGAEDGIRDEDAAREAV